LTRKSQESLKFISDLYQTKKQMKVDIELKFHSQVNANETLGFYDYKMQKKVEISLNFHNKVNVT
jgi:hypothetical protein